MARDQTSPSSSSSMGSPGSSGLRRAARLIKRTWQRQRAIPFVQQLEAADCGAACLAMVLGYHGRNTKLDEARRLAGQGIRGSDSLSLVRAGEWLGLQGRGVRLGVDDVGHLPRAAILHWEFNHFVVFDRVRQGGVDIVDPAFGRRFVPASQFRRSFTGIALTFEPSATFVLRAGEKSRLWAYLRQLLGQRTLMTKTLVTSVMLRIFALAVPIVTALIVDTVLPRGDRYLITIVAAGLAGILLFQFLSELIRAHFLLQLRTNLDTRMTLGFLDHLVSLPYEFFQRRSSGDLLMRVTSNTILRERLTAHTLSTLLDGVLVLVYLLLIVLLSWAIGALVLVLGAIQAMVFALSRRRYRELMSQDLESQARAQSYLVQILAGIETLKVTGAEHRAVQHWSNLFVDELNVALRRGRLAALVESLQRTLQAASPLLVLSYGAVLVMNSELSLGVMLAINALAVGFLTPLGTLVDGALRLQLLGSYIERIDDVLATEPEQDTAAVARAPRLSGRITLDNVSFGYTGQGPLVVRGASLVVEAGAHVAIVGKSGSGKSTLAALLCGLYQPTQGSILYDGQPLAGLDLRSVRRQIGVVLQKPYVFSGSIHDNIALTDPGAERDRVILAARKACIHDDIARMPMGYKSLVADGGSTLSGGQRQRIALARALLGQPAILLLDEATSALDSKTERAVMQNLAALACTRIVIAHRLSTVARADQIVVMDGGAIVEVGTHGELMRRGGAYADLVAAQASVPHDAGAGEASDDRSL